VHPGDASAAQSELGSLSAGSVESLHVDPVVWEVLGATLDADDASRIVDEVGEQFSSTMRSLMPG
jgi:hypothetical protein